MYAEKKVDELFQKGTAVILQGHTCLHLAHPATASNNTVGHILHDTVRCFFSKAAAAKGTQYAL